MLSLLHPQSSSSSSKSSSDESEDEKRRPSKKRQKLNENIFHAVTNEEAHEFIRQDCG